MFFLALLGLALICTLPAGITEICSSCRLIFLLGYIINQGCNRKTLKEANFILDNIVYLHNCFGVSLFMLEINESPNHVKRIKK